MSDVETLRRAASLMRERAEASVPGPWRLDDDNHLALVSIVTPAAFKRGGTYSFTGPSDATTIHIASWPPAVALAVAGVLESDADAIEFDCGLGLTPTEATSGFQPSIALARTYLGKAS